MKQTAVEYLWKALIENGFAEIEDVEGFYYQAKEMEKQQIVDAKDCWLENEMDGEEYYNETFKK